MNSNDPVLECVRGLSPSPNGFFWVGFSGGLDSSVLLHATLRVFGAEKCRAIHVDHGLNEQSDRWAEYCKSVATDWGVQIYRANVQVSAGNVESQARKARYAEFKKCLAREDVLLLAHHADDDVETLLWQILTGRAVLGIPFTRTLGKGKLFRPLLRVTRDQLSEYVEKNRIDCIEDPSNRDLSFDRNWIRHRLLPEIKGRFPKVLDSLNEIREEELEQVKPGPLDLASLNGPLTERHLRSWLHAYEIYPTGKAVLQILKQTESREDAMPSIKVSAIQHVRRYRDRWYVVPRTERYESRNVVPGEEVELPNGTLSWVNSEKGYRASVPLELTSRPNLEPDAAVIEYSEHTKKLKSLFQEKAIPPWQRDTWPLLVKNGKVICVPNLAKNEEDQRTSSGDIVYEPVWRPRVD